jgi:hypothetical protein
VSCQKRVDTNDRITVKGNADAVTRNAFSVQKSVKHQGYVLPGQFNFFIKCLLDVD